MKPHTGWGQKSGVRGVGETGNGNGANREWERSYLHLSLASVNSSYENISLFLIAFLYSDQRNEKN